MSCFLARLKHEIELMVHMFNPKTWQETCSLAKLQEVVKNDHSTPSQVHGRGFYNQNQGGSIVSQLTKPNPPLSNVDNLGINKMLNQNSFVKKYLNFTPKQMKEMRQKS